MVSGIGVDSGQQMSEAYLNPTTDFRPTGSPFVRQLGKVPLDPVFVTVPAEPVDSVRIAQELIARATPRMLVDIRFIVNKPAAFINMPSGLENPASVTGVVQRLLTPRADSPRRIAWAWRAAVMGSASGIASASSRVNQPCASTRLFISS
jgi:hypothetical protein